MGEQKRRLAALAALPDINPQPTVLRVEMHTLVVAVAAPCERCGKVFSTRDPKLVLGFEAGEEFATACPCGQMHVLRKPLIIEASSLHAAPETGALIATRG